MPIPYSANAGANSAINDLHLAHYAELGKWARHYSAVRMTVGIFFLASSLGVLMARWDRPDWGIAGFLLAYFAVGAVLYAHFSFHAFQQLRAQIDLANTGRSAVANAQGIQVDPIPQPPSFWRNLSGGPTTLAASLAFAAVVIMWVARNY
jgi:hypothetical protein